MIEIELKYILEKPELTQEKMRQLGFIESMAETYELSIMYDTSEGFMQKKDGRIRVRKSGNKTEFCYKKPISREGVKKEIEYEVLVSDRDILNSILSEMGYRQTTSYERYRTEYRKGGIKVTIDRYPFATFIEIEGGEAEIWSLAEKLELDEQKNLTDSCDTLFTKWRAEKGLPLVSHMRFDDFDK